MHHQSNTPTTARGDGQTVLRPATEADQSRLQQLAELDSAPRPTGEVLVAQRADELVAAIAVETGTVIANPFRHTAAAVGMLVLQHQELRAPAASRRRRSRRWRGSGNVPGPASVGT